MSERIDHRFTKRFQRIVPASFPAHGFIYLTGLLRNERAHGVGEHFDQTLLGNSPSAARRRSPQSDQGTVDQPIVQCVVGFLPSLEGHPADAGLSQQAPRPMPEQHQSRNRAHREAVLTFGHETQSAQAFAPFLAGGR